MRQGFLRYGVVALLAAVLGALVTAATGTSAQTATLSDQPLFVHITYEAYPPKTGTPPPAGWMETWSGGYGGAPEMDDSMAPPGFKVVNPMRSLDEAVVPVLRPWAAARRAETNFQLEDAGAFFRQNGMFMHQQVAPFTVIPSPGKITVLGGGGPRRFYLNRGHLKTPPLTRSGDSVAHWEGDTLVVDTVGFDDTTFLEATGSRHSTELHVIERWRLVANGTWMEKVFVVDDPRAFTAPYTYTRYYRKLPPTAELPGGLIDMSSEALRTWVSVRNEGMRDENRMRAAAAQASSNGNGAAAESNPR